MQLDDLKPTWEKEMKMQSTITEFGDMRRRAETFDRKANMGWGMELLVAAGLIIFILAKWLVWPPAEEIHILFHVGMMAMVVGVMFVAVKILYTRRITITDDWTLHAKINIQIEKREKEFTLLNTVASWYLSPLFVAVFLGSYGGYAQRTGSHIPNTKLLVYWAVCVVLYIGIYFYNKYQAKRKVQPVLEELYVMKRELEK